MTIDEAIKLLQLELHPAVTLSTHNSKDAIKLGIEALKRLEAIRNHRQLYIYELLPGETKD